MKQTFALHPSLNPDYYIMTNSLRQHAQWRARNYTNNNMHGEVGDMTEIGYVMISLTDNTIIPISHGDEHHTGYDLLYDFKKINSDDYIPVYAKGSSNYIYRESDIPNMLTVYRKFLSYGGVDGIVTGANDLRGKKVMMSDFVESNGFVEIKPGTLAPIGKRIYDDLVSLSNMISALQDTDDRIKTKGAFVAAAKLIQNAMSLSHYIGIPTSEMKEIVEELRRVQKENNLQGLREIIFGFHSFKNKMHHELKKDKSGHFAEMDESIWGDVDLSIDMLGRI